MIIFLIIDDNKDILNAYKQSIESKFDADIDCAHNGIEALKKLDLFQYDVILSDIDMPGMNGIELYKELKERHPVMAERMAFISGSIDGPDGLYLKEEGLPLLAKPFKLQDLLILINSVLKLQGKAAGESNERRYPRKAVKGNCTIEFFAENAPEQINGMVVNYSDGGMCITYKGGKIRNEENVFVYAETLGIERKKAEVVWTKADSNFMQSGLKWAAVCSTGLYH